MKNPDISLESQPHAFRQVFLTFTESDEELTRAETDAQELDAWVGIVVDLHAAMISGRPIRARKAVFIWDSNARGIMYEDEEKHNEAQNAKIQAMRKGGTKIPEAEEWFPREQDILFERQ